MTTLFDRIVRHQVDIERAKAGEISDVNTLISENDKKVVSLIASLPESYTQKQLNKLIKDVSLINKEYYNSTVKKHLAEVAEISVSFETDFALVTVSEHLADGGVVAATSKKETLDRVLKTKYDGHKLPTWVTRLATDKNKRLNTAIRGAATSTGDTAKILSSSKDAIRVSNSNTPAVVKTYVNQSINFSRDDVYLANDDFVTELLWSSILDSGTTLICGVRSNKRYNARTKAPIGHDHLWRSGPGLIHWSCRSTEIPVNKENIITSGSGEGFPVDSGSRTAIGGLDDYERGDNKKSDGKRYKIPSVNNELEKQVISAKVDYPTWLKRQPRPFVEDAIGVKKADSFLSGKLTLDDFVVDDGSIISVKQLEQQLKTGR